MSRAEGMRQVVIADEVGAQAGRMEGLWESWEGVRFRSKCNRQLLAAFNSVVVRYLFFGRSLRLLGLQEVGG